MPWIEEWVAYAACRRDDPDALFVQGAAQQQAKLVCMGCPVRSECLAHALDTRTEFGVWGGMTERERRQLLRNRPDVRSWRRLLENAMLKHEASSESEAPGVPDSRTVAGSPSRQRPTRPHAPRPSTTARGAASAAVDESGAGGVTRCASAGRVAASDWSRA